VEDGGVHGCRFPHITCRAHTLRPTTPGWCLVWGREKDERKRKINKNKPPRGI